MDLSSTSIGTSYDCGVKALAKSVVKRRGAFETRTKQTFSILSSLLALALVNYFQGQNVCFREIREQKQVSVSSQTWS